MLGPLLRPPPAEAAEAAGRRERAAGVEIRRWGRGLWLKMGSESGKWGPREDLGIGYDRRSSAGGIGG